MTRFLLVVLATLLGISVFAQDCGCDYTIEIEDAVFNGEDVSPGDLICLAAGDRAGLLINRLSGEEDDVITIQACGGETTFDIDGLGYAISFENSSYFKVDGGSGTENRISVIGASEVGFEFESCTNFEIASTFFKGILGNAISVITEPLCDLSKNKDHFEIGGIYIHDLEINKCNGGIQLGHTAYDIGVESDDCEVLYPHRITDFVVANNIIKICSDLPAISIYGAAGEVSNNLIVKSEDIGLFIGRDCVLDINRNEFRKGQNEAILSEGNGEYTIINNVFNSNGILGTNSIEFDFDENILGANGNDLFFSHNTMVNADLAHVKINNAEHVTGLLHFENGIFCAAGLEGDVLGEFAPYFDIPESDLILFEDNIMESEVEAMHFADVGINDFSLTHRSPAINRGHPCIVEHDKVDALRNIAGNADAGAFEYYPERLAAYDEIEIIGIYVDDFKSILGDPAQETLLLEYCQSEGFNYLVLYNLSYIHDEMYDLTSRLEADVLGDFIERAKVDFGIVQVAAVGEKNASFDKIETYNELYTGNWFRQFDVLNLEFEFWANVEGDVFDYYCTKYLIPNDLPCTNEGAFTFYERELEAIDIRAREMGVLSEIYLGNPSEEEAASLVELVDRVLLHYYRTSDLYGDGRSIYNYKLDRFYSFLESERQPAIMPIFSARSYHMGPWLEDHSLHLAFDTWYDGARGFSSDDHEGLDELTIAGYQWYRYTSLLAIDPYFYGGPKGDDDSGSSDSDKLTDDPSVYPTLFSDAIKINIPFLYQGRENSVEITDVNGKIVLKDLLVDGLNTIEVPVVAKGFYIANIVSNDQVIYSEKLISN
ncbi:T9SS type A sorting domain-containing protein [Crocinitomix catalasitica]|uniref:T9SS type A sorting domain-containing protein n=1 Tax=Crocinitomix catalasitica TaxID=184607 RepID=UPI0004813B27|nr:T9SS type A sorting domain-containing protein [Crocinitomix catalasitica]